MKIGKRRGILLPFVLFMGLSALFWLLPGTPPTAPVAGAVRDLAYDTGHPRSSDVSHTIRTVDGDRVSSEQMADGWEPTLTFSPSRGPVGASVTLTGVGFYECKEDRVVRVWFADTDGSPALDWNVPDNVDLDDGEWRVTLRVPTGQPLGVFYVCALTNCRIQACNTFEVTSSAGPEELVSAPYAPNGPPGGLVGQSLRFSTGGSVCAAEPAVQYRFDWGGGAVSDWLDPVTAGNASHAWLSAGTYSLSAQARCAASPDDMSDWSERTSVVIYELAPVISLLPAEGCPGVKVKVTGSGFAANDLIPVGALSVDGVGLNTTAVPVDGLGGWEATISVPGDAEVGAHVVAVTAGGRVASATYTVLGVPEISLSPSTGRAGTLVSLAGSGFLPDDKIPSGGVSFGNATWDVSSVAVGASGAWEVRVLVPSEAAPGTHEVTVSTGLGCVATGTFTVTMVTSADVEIVSAPSAPKGPASGEVGRNLSFSASGAKSNLGHRVQYQFDWGNDTLSAWLDAGTAGHAWSVQGVYAIKARARCADHIGIVSAWSQKTTLTVLPPAQASFAFGNLTIDPPAASPAANVTIMVIVENIGDVDGSVEVPLKIGGVLTKVEKIALAAGANATVAFTVSRDTPGNYSVAVGELSGLFEVTPGSGVSLPMVGGTIFAVIILLLLAWLVRRLVRSI